MSLSGKVCIVTGASRGIGKGIALQLGKAGATVYITGRSLKSSDGSLGSLQETAGEIEARGGKCVPVQCDHSKDEDIQSLFDRVSRDHDGQLDLLVNNAYSAVQAIMDNSGVKFWDQPISMWDTVNNVGLRNHYLCTVHASRMMVPRKRGLIVNISSPGGLRYLFNVPYGVGKEAVDRMAADCGFELRKHNVAMVSLWPGAVRTEMVLDNNGSLQKEGTKKAKVLADMFATGESTEYAGKSIVSLMSDSGLMKKTGKIVFTSDIADEFGFTDIDGRIPGSIRRVGSLLALSGHTWLAALFPNWVKVPKWLLAMGGNKF